MTISLAWIRVVGKTRELVMAADSRLRFGCAWDCCPKILTLPRSDIAISFAGDTQDAYPLMLQMSSAVANYSRARNRAMDIRDLKGHAMRVFDAMRNLITDLPKGNPPSESPNISFILGGYSWQKKDFLLWRLRFAHRLGKFTAAPAGSLRGSGGEKRIIIEGDYKDEVGRRLVAKLKAKGKFHTGGLDMEPFEVLRDIIRTNQFPFVGGAPQVLKIYEHMNYAPYAVYWPAKRNGSVTLLGRPLLDYELAECLILDPDNLQTYDGRTGKVFKGGQRMEKNEA
jgi:hypothetical protein